MRRLINRIIPKLTRAQPDDTGYCKPLFETHQHARAVDLDVFVPGVQAADVDLVLDDHELVVTARRAHQVRANWQAANFEAVQRDYQLRVRLGAGIELRDVWAVLRAGILKIHLRRSSPRQPLELSVA